MNPEMHLLTRESIKAATKARDQAILEAFKIHHSPTETKKALGGIYSREVIRRVATRAGLWNGSKRELRARMRALDLDDEKRLYKRSSRDFRTELDFQNHISEILNANHIPFMTEKQVPGFQSRADFVGLDFVIEAKNTVASDELCRGLGQAMIYRKGFPNKKIAIVYPSDLSPRINYAELFIENDITLIGHEELLEWLN